MPAYNVIFYCPDTNFLYNGDTPDQQGVGGGKTAIVRLAKALAGLGEHVTCFINCDRPGLYAGVEYHHFKEVKNIKCDILIATTSGGDLDLSSLLTFPIEARLKTILVHGTPKPNGLEKIPYDIIYVPSYYLKEVVVKNWKVPADNTYVCYHGVEESNFIEAEKLNPPRDPFSMVYFGHPTKGLDVAIDIVKELRKKDERFHLDIYGGYELHGQPHQSIDAGDGFFFKGLVGQKELAKGLFKYGFCLTLQDYPEPFGIAVLEAKRAGVIVIASKVGAHAETISDGYDGLMIEEDYRSKECKDKVLRLVEYTVSDKEYADYIRDNARKQSFSWQKAGQNYVEHWNVIFKGGTISEKKFLISGSYGSKNVGDETELKCVLETIKEIDSKAKATVVSVDPFYNEKKHKCRAVRKDNFASLAHAVKESDFVLLGGGGLFQDYDKIKASILFDMPYYGGTSFAVVPILAKIYNKPLFYYAQGFGPLFSDESIYITKFACDLADIITVRDKPSFDLLKFINIDANKIYLTADPAVNLKLLPDDRITFMFLCENLPRDRRFISIVVRFWIEKYIEENVIKALAGAIDKFLKFNPTYCVVFIPFCPDDIHINERIIDLVENKENIYILRKEYGPEELATFISKSDVLIGMRFHSCVFAAIGHVPFIALNYDYKVEIFAKEMGLDDFIVELIGIDSENIFQKLQICLNKRTTLSLDMKNRINSMTIKEKSNFKYFMDFLNESSKRIRLSSFKDNYIYILHKRILSLNYELEFKEREIENYRLRDKEEFKIRTDRESLNNQLIQINSEKEKLIKQIEFLLAEENNLRNKLKQATAEKDAFFTQLNNIYASNFWKIANGYYKIRQRMPIVRSIYGLLRARRSRGDYSK